MADAYFTLLTNPGNTFKNLAGQRFGELTAIEPVRHVSRDRIYWRCRCDCGSYHIVSRNHLQNGHTTSCGCTRYAKVRKTLTRHGLCFTATHNAWIGLRYRCTSARCKSYPSYGGRGITYDPRWDSFDAFLADMGEAPPGTELDRKDNSGNYCKDNCRWVTCMVNNNNRRSNRHVEYNNKTFTVAELSREVGMDLKLLYGRLANGFSVVEAVTLPLGARRQTTQRTSINTTTNPPTPTSGDQRSDNHATSPNSAT